jgi:hypothetical protein
MILLAGCIVIFPGTSAQDTNNVFGYYKNNYIFNTGFWVYQDTVSLETDSITLDNVKHGFYGPNPVALNYREYYTLEYYSHTNDSSFNDFFLENLWRVNGGGQWAELGQPVMLTDNLGPLMGGYNGFEILDILDSLVVGNNTFYDVARSHVYEDQQYQHEFNFDTDIFYAEDVGIVRKAYTDDEGVNHSWDLVNWEVELITSVNEINGIKDDLLFFPNPTSGYIRIVANDPVDIEICNLQGEVLLKSQNAALDLTGFADGIYLVRISSKDGRLLKADKIVIQ